MPLVLVLVLSFDCGVARIFSGAKAPFFFAPECPD
jgi:hypothetical protein